VKNIKIKCAFVTQITLGKRNKGALCISLHSHSKHVRDIAEKQLSRSETVPFTEYHAALQCISKILLLWFRSKQFNYHIASDTDTNALLVRRILIFTCVGSIDTRAKKEGAYQGKILRCCQSRIKGQGARGNFHWRAPMTYFMTSSFVKCMFSQIGNVLVCFFG